MAIDEASRHQLHRDLERSLGSASATALMELLPPVGWADVATKRDLDMVRVEFKGELDAMEGRLRQEIGVLDGRIGRLEGKIDAMPLRLWAANLTAMIGVAALVLAAVRFA